MIEKLRNLGLAQFAGMPFAMEENKLPNLIPIGFFGARAEMSASTDRMDLIHQARRGTGVKVRGLANWSPYVSLLVEG